MGMLVHARVFLAWIYDVCMLYSLTAAGMKDLQQSSVLQQSAAEAAAQGPSFTQGVGGAVHNGH